MRGLRGVGLLVLAAACGGAAGHGAHARFEGYDAGAVSGGPGAGGQYGFGRPASVAEVARWDTDVGPDGAELPAGAGTVAQGAALFATACASCHGPGGAGGIPGNPTLVGRDSAFEGFRFATRPKGTKTVGNYWPYATTLFDYIKRAMPLAAPGSLRDDEVYALTAYVLAGNGILDSTVTLDAARLRAVRMPYRDRFVPDDRGMGPEVR